MAQTNPNQDIKINSNNKPEKKIGLIMATIFCINAMVGVGIFTTPAKLATSVGPAGIITYLFVIAAVFFIALSIARVAEYYPQEGSFYNYAKQWGGHTAGVIAAGSYILGVTIGLGLLTQVASDYLFDFYPAISKSTYGVIVIAAITLLNLLGVRTVQSGQIFLLACTLFAITATTILCLSNANLANLKPFMPYGYKSFFQAISASIFGFLGFESAASLFNIVEKPEKNISRALLLSLLVVGLLYITFISSIILAIPASAFVSQDATLRSTLAALFPKYKWVASLIGGAILTAIFGVLQSMIYSVSLLTESFLKVLKSKKAQEIANNPNGFKAIILAVSSFILLNFFFLKNKGAFFNLTALFIILSFSLSIITLIAKGHNKTVWQKTTTYLALIIAGFIIINAVIGLLNY